MSNSNLKFSNVSLHQEEILGQAGEVVHWSRAPAALTEDPGWIPCTHVVVHNYS